MAAYFGWLPALIWILIGCVFVGAFHDFASLVISVRNRGRTVSFVMEKLMGITGRQLFLAFSFLCLILVIAIFTLLIAGLFTKFPEVATASILFILLAPLFTFTTVHWGLSLKHASFYFIPMVFISVYIGQVYPLNVGELLNLDETQLKNFWICVLALYIFAASVIPVQWLLQPRDYMNSWLLYVMLALGFAAILAYNPEIKMNSFEGWKAVTGDGKMTAMIPALFIYIACGACSGFHSLVSSGTTSKQLDNERDAKKGIEAANRMAAVCPEYKIEIHYYAARVAWLIEDFNNAIKHAQILLDNPNLIYTLSSVEPEIGTVRESFFCNQLAGAGHQVEYGGLTTGDFRIDRNVVIEVGGPDKSFRQVKDEENGYVAADDIESAVYKKIPLWAFGFLY